MLHSVHSYFTKGEKQRETRFVFMKRLSYAWTPKGADIQKEPRVGKDGWEDLNLQILFFKTILLFMSLIEDASIW